MPLWEPHVMSEKAGQSAAATILVPHTLWRFIIAIENGPFSSLIYPLKMAIFQFTMLVYQRVVSPVMRLILRNGVGYNGMIIYKCQALWDSVIWKNYLCGDPAR